MNKARIVQHNKYSTINGVKIKNKIEIYNCICVKINKKQHS